MYSYLRKSGYRRYIMHVVFDAVYRMSMLNCFIHDNTHNHDLPIKRAFPTCPAVARDFPVDMNPKQADIGRGIRQYIRNFLRTVH
ncbi:Fatty acid amide hydrolase [Fusarium oxysporum f. sp. albedinis]|nr:Fatty acid amide hydrolase [Fusarium oxysporum f. sp. albedinis]